MNNRYLFRIILAIFIDLLGCRLIIPPLSGFLLERISYSARYYSLLPSPTFGEPRKMLAIRSYLNDAKQA